MNDRRRPIRTGPPAALAMALCLAGCSETPHPIGPPERMDAPAGRAYEVVLERPIPVGRRFRLRSTGAIDERLSAGGQAVPGETVRAAFVFESEVEALKVNRAGLPQKVRHKVMRLEITENGRTRSPVAPGKVISAEDPDGAERSILLEGEAVEGKLERILRFAIQVQDDKAMSITRACAPDGPQKVGDGWKPDAAGLIAGFRSPVPLRIEKEDVAAAAELEGLYRVGGTPCMNVSIEIRFARFSAAEGSIKAAGRAEALIRILLPLDEKLPSVGGSMNTEYHVEVEQVEGGRTIRYVFDARRRKEVLFLPLAD
ncbi:MAG: hypothetical protein JXR96_12270 [Deltaproteobacteria bacterium]|nr:hypothetical protein [Deltaproteobacteria bacterium]